MTYLLNSPDSFHALPNEHGRRILEAVAETWNRSGYTTSDTTSRCRADYATEAARKKFTLSIS